MGCGGSKSKSPTTVANPQATKQSSSNQFSNSKFGKEHANQEEEQHPVYNARIDKNQEGEKVIMASYFNGTVKVFSITKGFKEIFSEKGNGSSITNLWSGKHGDTFVAGFQNGDVKVFRYTNGAYKLIETTERANKAPVISVRVQNRIDGYDVVLSGYQDGFVRFYLASGSSIELNGEFNDIKNPVKSVGLSPDGYVGAIGYNSGAIILYQWNQNKYELKKIINSESAPVNHLKVLDFGQNNKALVVVHGNNLIKTYKLQDDYQSLGDFASIKGSIMCLHGGGQTFAVGLDTGAIEAYQYSNQFNKVDTYTKEDGGPIYQIKFCQTNTGSYYIGAVYDAGFIQILEGDSQGKLKELQQIRRSNGRGKCISFMRNGEYALCGFSDGTLAYYE